jgi:hypothetical protein
MTPQNSTGPTNGVKSNAQPLPPPPPPSPAVKPAGPPAPPPPPVAPLPLGAPSRTQLEFNFTTSVRVAKSGTVCANCGNLMSGEGSWGIQNPLQYRQLCDFFTADALAHHRQAHQWLDDFAIRCVLDGQHDALSYLQQVLRLMPKMTTGGMVQSAMKLLVDVSCLEASRLKEFESKEGQGNA